jgi:UDP-GlcNAc:undecaprenyl-phosphate/decaprenyl-phosphate GlcNAc-1-phosphate transferase
VPSVAAYLVVLGVAAAVTYAGTWVMRLLAPRIGAIVPPGDRRVHARPTATAGGAAMFVGFLAAIAVAWALGDFSLMFETSSEVLGIVVAASIIFVVGMIDDLRDMSAPAKTAGMVLAGSALTFAGVALVVFRVPFFGISFLSGDLSVLVTVIWVIGMMNAINLIDGLDGLAAGIVGIAALTFFLYAMRLGNENVVLPGNMGALIAVIAAGLCLGFLPHNFHPARIFMGDTGALLLGLLMAISTILVGGRTSESFSGQAYFFFAPIFIPVVILGVPILDTLLAIVRRASKRRGIAEADKDHLHHRLLRLGHTQIRSVLILWGWTALLSGLVLYPTYNHGEGNAAIPLGIAALGLALFTVLHPLRRRTRGPGVDPRQATLPFEGPPIAVESPPDSGPAARPGGAPDPAASPPPAAPRPKATRLNESA